MNRFTIGKTGLVLALFAALLSGCVTNRSSIVVEYPTGKPSEGTQLFFRYSTGEVVQVPDIGDNSSIETMMDIDKKIVGGYAQADGIAWVPYTGYPSGNADGNRIQLVNIPNTKPATAADHVKLTKAPEVSPNYPGYLSYTVAVYDNQNQLVNNQTEIFMHGDDPNLEFHSLNVYGDQSVKNGYSYFTQGGGLVTFAIKSVPITKPISVYSGSTLLTDNLLSIVTDVKVTSPNEVYSLQTGETMTLNAEIMPLDAINPTVTWSVINETGTATIDATTGVLTAGDLGTVLVQATATDGSGVVGSVRVTITPFPILVNSIAVSGSNSVQVGQSTPLTASILPADATNRSIVWTVQNGTGKATIDTNGVLTGTSAGTVLVQAKAADLSGVFGTKTVEITAINNGGTGGNSGGSTGGSSGGGSSSTPTTTPTPAPTPVVKPDPTPEPTTTPTVVPGPKFNEQVVNLDNLMTSLNQKIKAAQSSPAVQLSDTSTHWAATTVNTFVKLGVVTGYSDGSFHPNASITRAEFATLIAKVFDLSSSQGSVMSDVSGHWAEASIRSLQGKGVLSGYPDGTFKPNQEIKRSEMIAIISRIMDLTNVITTEAPVFTDLEQTWNKEQLQQAAAAGIITGDGKGEFYPANSASRAEALTIVLRVLQTNPELGTLLESIQ
ncbi:S-layer homology domain-containing protein [Paenibacillus taichungensis]|uniref:S-layer homology domain-containing protein n=1 Tax=Paenibacillus taichungensis TaxID=484184 RepID=UPI0039A7793B